MAGSLLDIRRKMKGFKATRQVTKAMELVSASKMRRAVHSAQVLRDYALSAWEILHRLSMLQEGKHLFLTERPAKKVLAIVFSSDRGLCGTLNAHLFKSIT